jgi:hypothetical protein
MGDVQDRWYKTVKSSETGKVTRVRTELYGKGMRYKVRYLDPDGKEVSRTFPDRAKRQADEFLHKVENEKREGSYLDPHGGKVNSGTMRSNGYRVSLSSRRPESMRRLG